MLACGAEPVSSTGLWHFATWRDHSSDLPYKTSTGSEMFVRDVAMQPLGSVKATLTYHKTQNFKVQVAKCEVVMTPSRRVFLKKYRYTDMNLSSMTTAMTRP